MNAYLNYLNNQVNKCKQNFADYYDINWAGYHVLEMFEQKRNQLFKINGNQSLFKNTKPFYLNISEGCKICGEGKWSCLFITGICNASCFYCPSSQKKDEIPVSQGLSFNTPQSYAEYISYFNFKGVGFSGGEPLMVENRLLDYLREIRKACDPDVYIWMYTNGLLVNKDILHKLAANGLNEIRFDIGANKYKLDKVRLAKGIIKNITVEIPAVPEDVEKIKKILPEMIDAGVRNLNLHQLRLTTYNAKHLLMRGYSYLAAEKPVVLESELAALEILEYARDNGMEIGINYCSFWFKNRFQQAGFRKVLSHKFHKKSDDITEKGFIRKLINENLQYSLYTVTDNKTFSNEYKLLELEHKNYILKNKRVFNRLICDEALKIKINNIIMHEPDEIPEEKEAFYVWFHEYIEKGLR